MPPETARIMPSVFSDDELRALHVPVLLLIGEREVIYDPAKALARARALLPNFEGELVPQSSHDMCASQYQIVDARVLDFLNSNKLKHLVWRVIMIILATILSGLSLLMSVLFLIHLRSPPGWIVLFAKLAAGALSPIWAIMGAVGAVIGWVYGAFWADSDGDPWCWHDDLVCLAMHPGSQRVLKMPLAPAGKTRYPLSRPSIWFKSAGHGF